MSHLIISNNSKRNCDSLLELIHEDLKRVLSDIQETSEELKSEETDTVDLDQINYENNQNARFNSSKEISNKTATIQCNNNDPIKDIITIKNSLKHSFAKDKSISDATKFKQNISNGTVQNSDFVTEQEYIEKNMKPNSTNESDVNALYDDLEQFASNSDNSENDSESRTEVESGSSSYITVSESDSGSGFNKTNSG